MTKTTTMVLHRDMAVEIEARAEGETPTLTIAMSSETPVLRYDWWTGERYYEVLDHAPGGIDLSYARDGVPFLLDHENGTQIGLVTGITLGSDRKLRGVPVFGAHPDAAWVEQDMRSGIRKKVSVGYDPGTTYAITSAKDDKVPTRKYTGWRLYETSSVAVPADYDVGVARSAFEGRAASGNSSSSSSREANMSDTQQGTTPAPATIGAAVGRDYDGERKARNAQMANIAKLAGREDLLGDALSRDVEPGEFAREVLAANAARASAPVPAGHVDMSARETREFSVMRAIMGAASAQMGNRSARDEAGLEFEVSDTIAKRLGAPKGIWLPMNLTADRNTAAQFRTAVTGNLAGTTSLGLAGVQVGIQSLVEILRNEALVAQMGTTFLTGLTGNLQFPRQITANTWSWEGEDPATAKALTAATFDTFTMSPKTGYGATAYSKQFLVQSSFSAEQMVREDLARITALGIDSAAISGTGASNQPTGILTTASVGTVAIGTNGGPMTWAKAVEFETTQATANAARGRLAFLTTPGVRGSWKGILRTTVAGANFLWADNNTVNGYDAYATNQMPSNLTKGTSTTVCHGVIFGNWQELIIGTWGDAIDVLVNPYIYQTQGMIQVVQNAMVDVGVRHPKSFTIDVDVTV